MLNCSSKLCVPPMVSIIAESQRLSTIRFVMLESKSLSLTCRCCYYKYGASCIDWSSGLGRVGCLIYESAVFLL